MSDVLASVVSDLMVDLKSSPKALLCALGAAIAWGLYVRQWKKSLEKNMGFVGVGLLDENDYFDYVIIGGGTAGCILASRLSEDPACKVLLLEAGRPAIDEMGVRAPALWTSIWHTPDEWAFSTIPQASMGDRALRFHRARLLGGNGNNDFHMYGNGISENYTTFGAGKWNFASLSPYFKITDHSSTSSTHIHKNTINSALGIAFNGACGQVQPPLNEMKQLSRLHGVAQSIVRISKQKLREHSASLFLSPVFQSRKNLTIKANAYALKIVTEGNRAIGVEVDSPQGLMNVKAQKEVILCGGPICSPLVLLHSGIGEKNHLEEIGISCVADLPHVGQNLKDQLLVPLSFQTHDESHSIDNALFSFPKFLKAFFQYNVMSKGIFYEPYVESFAFECSESDSVPSLQYLLSSRNLKECHDCGEEGYQEDEERVPSPGGSITPVLLHPASTGSVKLQSDNPYDCVTINPEYFSNQEDLDILAYGAKRAYEMVSSSSFSTVSKSFVIPDGLKEKEADDDFWAHFVRQEAQSANHQIGTCRMGTDASNSVVNEELLVHGFDNLRVIDSSVIPDHISFCSSRGITMAIAEKAAVLVKEKSS